MLRHKGTLFYETQIKNLEIVENEHTFFKQKNEDIFIK